MPYQSCWAGGMWIIPLIFFAGFALFGKKCFGGPRRYAGKNETAGDGPETALDILKRRDAKGDLSKDEFENMKRDILQ